MSNYWDIENKGKGKEKCGECEDYYCCKSDRKVIEDRYLPKNKRACKHFNYRANA